MATESKASKPANQQAPQGDWLKRETFGRFLRDVSIAAVILGVGLWIYRGNVETGKKVRALGKEAKEQMVKDTPRAYVEAEKKLKATLELDSKFPFAVASLAELYGIRWIDLGMADDAAKAREWAKKADGLDAKINERFGAVILSMLGDKKFADAEKYATELSKQAASSHVINGLGRAFRGEGKLDEAKIALKKSADTEWRNPRFACDIGDVYFEDGDFVNAQAFYGKGVEANSEHARSLIGRARAQIARGNRIKDATDTLTEVLQRPDDQLPPKLKAQALTATSELRFFEQKYGEAAQLADQAIAAYGEYPWAHFAKGRALAAEKNLSAGPSLEKAIALDRYVPQFYYVGAVAMFEAGDSGKALGILDACGKALKEDDRFDLAYGNMLAKIGRTDEALARFEKAIEFNNFNAAARYAKASVLIDAKKDFENSKTELETALEVQEYFPDAYKRLGDILFEKKEWADGCQQYAQALVQMKQLQTPRERMSDLRETVNTRLVKEAKDRNIAKAWMEETAAFVR